MKQLESPEKSKKFWNKVRFFSIAVYVIFVIISIADIFVVLLNDVTYPYVALGLDVHNWFEQYQIDMAFIVYVGAIPIVIATVLLIIAIVKLKKLKQRGF